MQGEYEENPDGTLRPTRAIPGGRGSSLFPACQNMMLAAHALGVSSLFTTFFGLCEPDVKQLLHVPPRMFLEAAVFLGYGDEPLGKPRRKPLDRGRPPGRLGGAVPTMTTIPRIVSADDHVVEPPDVFTSRLPAKYRDVGPRVVRAPVAEMTFRGGNYVTRMGTVAGRRRAARRLVALRGPAVAAHPARRVRGLRARGRAGRAR